MLIVYTKPSATVVSSSSKGCILPYATTTPITPSTDYSGELERTNALGFGTASGNITVTKTTVDERSVFSFTINSNDDFISFPMPYDAKITAVRGRYSTIALWSPSCDMALYVAVAIAPASSNKYTIIPESKAIAPSFINGTSYPNRTVLTGIADNLNISVKAGENVMLITGYDTSNGAVLHSRTPFNYTGSIAIEKDEGTATLP